MTLTKWKGTGISLWTQYTSAHKSLINLELKSNPKTLNKFQLLMLELKLMKLNLCGPKEEI